MLQADQGQADALTARVTEPSLVIGVLQFELWIHDASSLKDKRRVVRSLKDRLHRDHLVSVAEVGALDRLNLALMAVSLTGSDGARVGSVLDRISTKLRSMTDAELGETCRELIKVEEMGVSGRDELDDDAIAEEMYRRAAESAQTEAERPPEDSP